MAILIHRLERNLIKIAKKVPPECVGDSNYIDVEKNRFINYHKQKNTAKK
jgi:hypothetical protein